MSPAQTPRFMKIFCYACLMGREEYMKRVRELDLERLAGLVRVFGFLLQTKVYLFWSSTSYADSEANAAIIGVYWQENANFLPLFG